METRLPTVYRNYCRDRNKVKNMIKYTRKQKEKCISGNIKNNPKGNQTQLYPAYMLIPKIQLVI